MHALAKNNDVTPTNKFVKRMSPLEKKKTMIKAVSRVSFNLSNLSDNDSLVNSQILELD